MEISFRWWRELRTELPILERAYLLADQEGEYRLAADLAGVALHHLTEARLVLGEWPSRQKKATELADWVNRERAFSNLLDEKNWDLADAYAAVQARRYEEIAQQGGSAEEIAEAHRQAAIWRERTRQDWKGLLETASRENFFPTVKEEGEASAPPSPPSPKGTGGTTRRDR